MTQELKDQIRDMKALIEDSLKRTAHAEGHALKAEQELERQKMKIVEEMAEYHWKLEAASVICTPATPQQSS